MDSEPAILPAHIEETVKAIAQLHADHELQATPYQRLLELVTARVSRPSFLGFVTLLVGGWLGGNIVVTALGRRAIDPPPFSFLQSLLSLAALYMTLIILSTQRRADKLAAARDQLTLELAILGEQKTAKVIALMEEARRDNPLLQNRHDEEAHEMGQAADPVAVLDAILESHAPEAGPNAPAKAG